MSRPEERPDDAAWVDTLFHWIGGVGTVFILFVCGWMGYALVNY